MLKQKSPFTKDQPDKNKHKYTEAKPIIHETFQNSPIYVNKTLNTKKIKQNLIDYNYSKTKYGNFYNQGEINLECNEVLISPSIGDLQFGELHQKQKGSFEEKYGLLWNRMKKALESYQQRQYEMKSQLIRLTERNQYLENGRILKNI